jgi:hypothetical protein
VRFLLVILWEPALHPRVRIFFVTLQLSKSFFKEIAYHQQLPAILEITVVMLLSDHDMSVVWRPTSAIPAVQNSTKRHR